MTLKLLIDDDSQALSLIKTLRKANHDAVTANEANLMGQPDDIVLEYAIQNNRIVLTCNCRGFEALHEANPLKKMSRQDIVNAIANLEAAQIPLQNQFTSLNHWNY